MPSWQALSHPCLLKCKAELHRHGDGRLIRPAEGLDIPPIWKFVSKPENAASSNLGVHPFLIVPVWYCPDFCKIALYFTVDTEIVTGRNRKCSGTETFYHKVFFCYSEKSGGGRAWDGCFNGWIVGAT